jgi:uncharacterized membrane protein
MTAAPTAALAAALASTIATSSIIAVTVAITIIYNLAVLQLVIVIIVLGITFGVTIVAIIALAIIIVFNWILIHIVVGTDYHHRIGTDFYHFVVRSRVVRRQRFSTFVEDLVHCGFDQRRKEIRQQFALDSTDCTRNGLRQTGSYAVTDYGRQPRFPGL